MDILPCPYCGSSAHLLGNGKPWQDNDGTTTLATLVMCENDGCMAQGPFLASDEQAAAAWNHVARIVAERKA